MVLSVCSRSARPAHFSPVECYFGLLGFYHQFTINDLPSITDILFGVEVVPSSACGVCFKLAFVPFDTPELVFEPSLLFGSGTFQAFSVLVGIFIRMCQMYILTWGELTSC